MAERQNLDDTKWIDKQFLSVDQEELKPTLRRPHIDNNPLVGEIIDKLNEAFLPKNDVINAAIKMLRNYSPSPAQDNGGEELKIAADKVLREVLIKYIEDGKISSKNREHAIIEAMIIFKNKH